jgi:hypothetical protein
VGDLGARAGSVQRLVDSESVRVPRRDLDIDGDGGGQRPDGGGAVPGHKEAVEGSTAQQVDGAQLVQGPQAPQREPVLLGDLAGLVERRLGRSEVLLACPATQDFERLAGQLGPHDALRVGEGGLGQPASLVRRPCPSASWAPRTSASTSRTGSRF